MDTPLMEVKVNPGLTLGSSLQNSQRVIDLRSIVKTEKKIVQILPITRKKHIDPLLKFRFFKDIKNDVFYGIVVGMRPDNTFEFKKMAIDIARTFNLENEREAHEFFICKNHPTVQGSPFAYGTPARYYVHDEEEQAVKFIKRREEGRKMEDFVSNMAESELRDFFRVLIPEVDNTSLALIRQQALQLAIEQPKRISEKLANPILTDALKIVHRCIASGLVFFDMGNSFYKTTSGVALGATPQAAATYLVQNHQLRAVLDLESKRGIEKNLNTNSGLEHEVVQTSPFENEEEVFTGIQKYKEMNPTEQLVEKQAMDHGTDAGEPTKRFSFDEGFDAPIVNPDPVDERGLDDSMFTSLPKKTSQKKKDK